MTYLAAISTYMIPVLIAGGISVSTAKNVVEATTEPKTAIVVGETGTPQPKERSIREYAQSKLGDQWESFDQIVQKESSWNPQAQNPKSTAQGLCQFLKQTRKNYGITVEATPEEQVDACIRYIEDRYGSPDEAWKFWKEHKWF